MRRKLMLFVLSACLLTTALTFGGFTSSSTAHAATTTTLSRQQAATTCYGGAVYFHAYPNPGANLGPYWKSSRCHDINIRFSSIPVDMAVDVCWTKYNYCRSQQYGYTSIYAGDTSWHVIAWNVLPGTEFTVQMVPIFAYSADVKGYVAF